MASSTPTCDICFSQQKTALAKIWCLECEESMCDDCSQQHNLFKGTRSHDTLPISEYMTLPDFVLKIGNQCSQHNKQYTVYCHAHECPGCISCSLDEHKLCSKVTPIETVVGNAKSSATLIEVEDILRDVSYHINSLQDDRKNNALSLHKQKEQIEKDVSDLRSRINYHLDAMQSKLLKDLYENEKRESEKIESVLKSLTVKKTQIEELKKIIGDIKKNAPDLQAFLAIREIEKRSDEVIKKITEMTEAGDFNTASLSYQVPKVISDLSSIHFGKIITKVSPSMFKLITSKDKQAQLPVDVLPTYSIESVSVKLNRSIDTGCQITQGCVVLPDGRSLFTCYDGDTITSIDKDGTHQYIKQLKPSNAFDIAYSEDMNKIFISSGYYRDVKRFHEMNLDDGNIRTLATDSLNYGVVVKHNKLIYCARGKGVCERSLSDGSVRVIVSDKLLGYCYVTEYRDQLYYTNWNDHSVTCCGMDGRQIWKFKNDVLKSPYGVSVDNYGNVYVVGCRSTNVIAISADGQRYKEILSMNDGLKEPQVLYYQRSTNQLLVANMKGKAFLFDVSFN